MATSGRSLLRRLVSGEHGGRSRDFLPGIVSLFDAHTAHLHLDRIVKVQDMRDLNSSMPHADPPKLNRRLSERHAYWLKDVYVWIDEGIVTTPDGDLIAETLPSHYRFVGMLRAGAYDHLPPFDGASERATEEASEITSLGGGRYFGNYFHRWVDELPRLQGLHRLMVRPSVLVPSTYSTDLLDVVRRIVPDDCRVRPAAHRKHWVRAERYLFLPNLVDDYCGYLPEDFVSNVRSRLLEPLTEAHEDDPSDGGRVGRKRLYVSRSGATRRRILNEDQVAATLGRFGFETVRSEDHSLFEQMRLFRDAEWIVGAHGAGLTNMIFSRQCNVLELFPGMAFTHYRWLSESLGHSYQTLCGHPNAGKHDDFEVDSEALARSLDS